MGQRSQIYVRFEDESIPNMKGLIALYFQWNYGERMISRTRQIIEQIKNSYKYGLPDIDTFKKRIFKAATVNFDLRAVDVQPRDIFSEIFESPDEYKHLLFNQDNCDGCLLIDVIFNQETEALKIKYALTDYNFTKPLTPEKYMKWDGVDIENKDYHDDDDRKCYYDNCKYIKENANLMTKEEIDEFVHTEYSIENAFDYDNLMFQYYAVKNLVENLIAPVKNTEELHRILKGVNRHVLYRLIKELKISY